MTESGTEVPCLGPADLYRAKRAANRPGDQVDLAYLKEKYGFSDE